MRKIGAIIGLCGCLSGALAHEQAQQSNMSDAPVPITHGASMEHLVLNGYAVYRIWASPGYKAALYVTQKSDNPKLILLTDAPTVMQFTFLQDDLSPEKMVQMFTEAMSVNNPNLDHNPYDLKRFKTFLSQFKQNLNAGDVLMLQYEPKDQTLIMLINNQEKIQWKQAKGFFNALLKMWIGEHPPTREFKQGILGQTTQ